MTKKAVERVLSTTTAFSLPFLDSCLSNKRNALNRPYFQLR